MSAVQQAVRPLCLALILAFSGSLYAHTPDKSADAAARAAAQQKEQEADRAALARWRKIIENTDNLFSLLGAEIAFNQGQTVPALNTYLSALPKTKDPEVAERAMELAISMHAYEIAEHIYRQWQAIEPQPGPAQRRIAWARALAFNHTDHIIKDLEQVVDEADEQRARRIFLLLAQQVSQNRTLAEKGNRVIRRAASRHPNMTEALIASALSASASGHDEQAIADLQKLSENDPNLTPPTRLALGVMVRANPKLLPEFFQKTDTAKLPQIWQELEVESLIQNKQNEQAYRRLQQLLEQQPNADLYIQAAVLSYQQQQPAADTLNYLDKAYHHGTQLQKSRAAVLSAIRLMSDHRYDEAASWVERITAPEIAFDKLVLQVSLAAEQRNWAEALRLSRQSKKAPVQEGRFFNQDDLQQLQLMAIAHTGTAKNSVNELTRIINHLEKTNGSRESLASALYQRGLLYSDKLRQFNRAVADFRHFLRLQPENTLGMNALGYTLLDKPEYVDEAYELIKKAYQKEPENAQVNDSLGWAYIKKGDPKSALPYLQYAYQQESDPEVAAHLGETYWLLGQTDKAREVWKEAWDKDRKHNVLNATLRKYKIRF